GRSRPDVGEAEIARGDDVVDVRHLQERPVIARRLERALTEGIRARVTGAAAGAAHAIRRRSEREAEEDLAASREQWIDLSAGVTVGKADIAARYQRVELTAVGDQRGLVEQDGDAPEHGHVRLHLRVTRLILDERA